MSYCDDPDHTACSCPRCDEYDPEHGDDDAGPSDTG